MAAITFGGAVAATAAPAEARPHHYRHYDRHHHGSSTGAAIAAGVVGLALGAVIANSGDHDNRHYSRGYAYRDPYYGDRYYRGRYARTCETSRWVWDPYIRERVLIRSHYAC
jgi:hypothetical protein